MQAKNMYSGRCKLNKRNRAILHETKSVLNFTQLHETNKNVLNLNIYVCIYNKQHASRARK